MSEKIEVKVPEFLKRGWDKKYEHSPEDLEFIKWIDAYEEKFGDGPPTEPSSLTKKEWCAILKECIAEGQTVEELLGIEYEEDCCD